MKKLFLLLFCMFSMITNADEIKIAMLQPRVAEGSEPCKSMELNMVRGELRKAFGWQSNFQVLTRTDIDAMMQEHSFQQSGMVDDIQRKQIGIMTSAQYICVSTITKEGSQLYMEAYLVNVETGQMTNPATQFVDIPDNNYSALQTPCNLLAKEMLGGIGATSQEIAQTAKEEVSSKIPAGYVDLGLPSETLWKLGNEDGLYSYKDAIAKFGNDLPAKEQFEELKRFCKWKWMGNGYKVVGPNKQSIFLPAEGYRKCSGRVNFAGSVGSYWSSVQNNSDFAWGLCIMSDGVRMESNSQCFSQSIRLVQYSNCYVDH